VKICCEVMRNMLSQTEEDGFSVKFIDEGISRYYVLVFNSYPVGRAGEYERFFEKNPDTPRLKTASRVAITYCPWCGRDLRKDVFEQDAKRRGLFWALKNRLGYPVD